MVQLLETDIRTSEVLGWKGVHLFHFHGSSCSQKTRIILNLKGVEWQAHPIDLPRGGNLSERFLGINPRGLVPTLVIDGEVHIESNDFVSLLDRRFPAPRLIPEGRDAEMAELLRHEDDLHHDLRTISFRFTQPRPRAPKSTDALANYRAGGSGTVLGDRDPNKANEIAFWERHRTRRDHRRGRPDLGGAVSPVVRRAGSSTEFRSLHFRRANKRGRYRLVHLRQPPHPLRLSGGRNCIPISSSGSGRFGTGRSLPARSRCRRRSGRRSTKITAGTRCRKDAD